MIITAGPPGEQLCWSEPWTGFSARTGEHEPSLATLSRLARILGVEFHIDITPDAFELRDTA